MMWILILLICSIPVSSFLWTNTKVTGIVGRSITINCRYNSRFKPNMKFWCHGWTRHCSYLVRTTDPGGQRGRISIKDYKAQRVFVVTMEDLRREDAGWYSCGIDKQDSDELRTVKLEVSDEPVSVPVIRFLTPNIWCFENLVSVSCESVQGSFPIRYTWYEKTQSVGSKISENNTLDLHCQLFKQQDHQYYCIASNTQGEKSSEMVKVTIVHRSERNCIFLAQIGNRDPVSLPELRFLSSPSNASCFGSSVSIFCERVQGSLPIHYTWYERTPSQDSKISNTSKLDLHCQSFTQQHHQYYCTASNTQGTKPSEMVNVSVTHRPGENCSYVAQISTSGADDCYKISTVSSTTTNSNITSQLDISYVVWDVIRWVFFTLLVICSVSVTMFPQKH
ncbi:Fc receptor-like protein 5 isoform X2 [Hemiscyllium ocellatum]|uniref:Fc receptor-like protein 5 isoform X2 n=1 Tax=Hemiscyllium ocellatum TaxID=170820 RepID=UPI00296644A8|nr:Fc receptor-like protein 5 isoform X2 [Hemiscyllium ocellatum]